ncbi:hypothetical protein [Streptomyces sp. NPDC057623]|uniref:hypothetical protein n=1 Tax=Streptomyces sp. NPDC057623 TaxID=3346187 RepID=UPI00367CC2DE
MLEGVLITESLRGGAEVTGIPLHITKITRIDVTTTAPDQPQRWTLLDFAAEEDHAEPLAEQMAGALAPTGGWYVNYNTTTEAFVIFPGKVFRYPRGQAEGRHAAQAHGRSIGIPEPQLDWQD